jgi:hypothetical protein
MSTRPEVLEALALVGAATGGRYRPHDLTGDHNKALRARVLSLIRGVNVPKAQAGVNAMCAELFALSGVDGACLNARENNFAAWAKATVEAATGGGV